MSHELAYFLKVNVAIVLFYAFYRLFFYKDTFFKWRRIALLCFLAVSILYPVLNIQEWIKEQEPMVLMADFYSNVILPEIGVTPIATSGKSNLLSYIYMGGVALLLIHFFIQLSGIIRLIFRTRKTRLQGINVRLLHKAQGPFSFFNWIFIYPDAHTEEEVKEILTHECTHASQWHSIDVLVSELVCVFCWFNPFAWLLKREIRNNLEFLADHNVLETGYDCKTYQYHLLGLAHQKSAAMLSNSFNVLPLKMRIKMMNKRRTKRIERTKYLMFLPLAGLLLTVSNIETIARTTERLISQVTQSQSEELPDLSLETFQGKVDVSLNEVTREVESARIDPTPIQNLTSEQSPIREETIQPLEHASPNIGREALIESNSIVNENIIIPEDDTIFEVVERMPEYPGGTTALMRFFRENIRYPIEAIKNNTQGRVIVQFVVNKQGEITRPEVVRSVSPELDQEALRVISNMPKWSPGRQRGKAVDVKYTVPVMFRLQDNTDQ